MMRSRSFIVILILFSLPGFAAQNKRADSLLVLLKGTTNDSARINVLNSLSKFYRESGKLDTALLLANQAMALALQVDSLNPGCKTCAGALGTAYANIGSVYYIRGDGKSALQHFLRALQRFQAAGDSKDEATALHNVGNSFYIIGNYPEALRNLYASLKIKERSGNEMGVANSLISISFVYQGQQDFKDELETIRKALAIYKKLGDKRGIAFSLVSMGMLNMNLRNYEEATRNHREALKIREALKDEVGIAVCYGNLGKNYLAQGKYEEAEKCYLSAYGIFNKFGDKQGLINFYLDMAKIRRIQKQPKVQKEYAVKAYHLSRTANSLEGSKASCLELSWADSALGDDREALMYYKLGIAYSDSLVNEENTKKTVRQQMQYEFEKKESGQKAEQEKKDAMAEADKHKQQIILYAVAGCLLLVLAFAVFIYRSFLQKQKANLEIGRQKNIIEEKQKEIVDSIHYARRIQASLMPSEKQVSRLLQRFYHKQ